MENRTTELLKDLEINKQIRISYNNQLQWSVCQTKMDLIKSELRGRLDALKEEEKFLIELDNREPEHFLNKSETDCIICELQERLASIQEEIKLIEEKI